MESERNCTYVCSNTQWGGGKLLKSLSEWISSQNQKEIHDTLTNTLMIELFVRTPQKMLFSSWFQAGEFSAFAPSPFFFFWLTAVISMVLIYYTHFCSSQLLKVNETSYQIRMAAFFADAALKWLLFCLIIMVLEKVLWLRLSQTVHQHNYICICFKQWQALPWGAGWYDSLVVHHPSNCTYKRNQIPEVQRPTSKGKNISVLPSPLPCTGWLERLFKYTVGFQLAFQIREKAP